MSTTTRYQEILALFDGDKMLTVDQVSRRTGFSILETGMALNELLAMKELQLPRKRNGQQVTVGGKVAYQLKR